MNKLLTLFLYIITFAASAQKNHISIGVEGGMNLTSLRGSYYIDNSNNLNIGYSAGAALKFDFKKRMSMQTGLYYSQIHSDLKIQIPPYNWDPGRTLKMDQTFHYLNLPLLLRATFGKKINYFFSAGPNLAFLLKEKEELQFSDGKHYTNALISEYNRLVFGFSGGMGILYPVEKRFSFSFEIRDNLGITPIGQNHIGATQGYYGPPKSYLTKYNIVNFLLGFNYKFGNNRIHPDSTGNKQRRVHYKICTSLSYLPPQNSSDSISAVLSYDLSESASFLRFNQRDAEGKSYSFDLLFNIALFKHLYLEIGAAYEKVTYKTKAGTVFKYGSWGNLVGYYTGYTNQIQLVQQYDFVSIPIIFKYQIPIKKINLSVGAGVAFNSLRHFKSTKNFDKWSYNYEYPNRYTKQTSLCGSWSFIVNAGVGYRFNKNLELGIEPQFKYYLPHKESIPDLYIAGYDNKSNFYSVGLNFYVKI